jgi:hypothetical protein
VVLDGLPGGEKSRRPPAAVLSPAAAHHGGQPGLLRGEPGPATDQEVLDVCAVVHGLDARTHPAGVPGPVSTRITRSFLDEMVTSSLQ